MKNTMGIVQYTPAEKRYSALQLELYELCRSNKFICTYRDYTLKYVRRKRGLSVEVYTDNKSITYVNLLKEIPVVPIQRNVTHYEILSSKKFYYTFTGRIIKEVKRCLVMQKLETEE